VHERRLKRRDGEAERSVQQERPARQLEKADATQHRSACTLAAGSSGRALSKKEVSLTLGKLAETRPNEEAQPCLPQERARRCAARIGA
jgi:hypothetical protein